MGTASEIVGYAALLAIQANDENRARYLLKSLNDEELASLHIASQRLAELTNPPAIVVLSARDL